LRLYRAEGIVLRNRELTGADRLLSLYTREYGRLRVAAYGAGKPSSRKRGAVQPFTRSEFLLGSGRDLDYVRQCAEREIFPHLRDDLENLLYAHHLAELVETFTPEGEPNGGLFALLLEALRGLGDGDPDLLVRAFEIKLLGLLGYRPELGACVRCGRVSAPGEYHFAAGAGGVVCARCAPEVRGARVCRAGTVALLRYLSVAELRVLRRIRVEDAVREEMRRLLEDYLAFHLEGRARSLALLACIKGKPGG
jgi:DNA repair protein RecO (recombination protein O)